MQLKFLALTLISAAVFSNVVYAKGSLVNVEDTNVDVDHVVSNAANNLDAGNALKNGKVYVAHHVADKRSVLRRRKAPGSIRRRFSDGPVSDLTTEQINELSYLCLLGEVNELCPF